MKNYLNDLSAKELLDEFGKGSHKPGSGSAAAMQGLISAQLAKTVISLTLSKPAYSKYHKRFEDMSVRLSYIIEELEKFFQEDCIQFDKHMRLRIKARDETNEEFKKTLETEATASLIPPTETVVMIGNLCVEMAELAIEVYDNGFKAVRGDAGVAVQAAQSGISGSVSIISLNLIRFPANNWTTRIRRGLINLIDKYRILSEVSRNQTDSILEEASNKNLTKLAEEATTNSSKSRSDIEDYVRRLQNHIFIENGYNVESITLSSVQETINPVKVLKRLGYTVDIKNSLGLINQNGLDYEVAAAIDKKAKEVVLSSNYSPHVRNFTAAHELGHAILHDISVEHRDIPVQVGSKSTRSKIEREADIFAAMFLMPRRTVKKVFSLLYKSEDLIITEETVLKLNAGVHTIHQFADKFNSLQKLAGFLAKHTHFEGNTFDSLSDTFSVSTEAMSNRLIELDLVRYNELQLSLKR